MDCSTPGFPFITNSQNLLKLMCIKSVMPSNHLNIGCPLLLPCFQSLPASGILRIRWPKGWSCHFSISPSKEYSGLIFRIDWFDLLAVQGTLQSLLQCHSSKASILQRLAFLMVPLTSIHDYWKNHSFHEMDLCQ